jgi:predicted LPLAT superfamily acyltransferase
MPKIAVRRRGNALGLWFFEMMLRLSGLKGAYLMLEVVCIYYALFDREAVRVSLAYITRRFPQAGVLQQHWHVYRLFVNQGRQLIDRYVIAHKPDFFNYQEISTEESSRIVHQSKKGLVMLTSHVGNWQVALRQMGGHIKKNVSIVMRPQDNPAVQTSLKIGIEAQTVRVINSEGHLGGVLEIMQALQEGDVVCIMGDRGYGFDTLEVPFLGAMAAFPYGAFLIAAAAGCPVVPLFTHKVSGRDYEADICNVWYPSYNRSENKKESLARWVGEYVKLLESFVSKYPYDCFLFHHVWTEDKGVFHEPR